MTGQAHAAAARTDSAYTPLVLEDCTPRQAAGGADGGEGTDGGRWICEGYAGIPVYVAEGDLRMFVSFGPDAANEIAASQTLPAFNTINETLEWRLADRGGGRPYATILRWFPQGFDQATGQPVTSQMLVVTRLGFALGDGGTCQIAVIDAQAVPDANARARQIADTMARDFDCERDEIIHLPR
ncbi:hypothetical protein D1F64_21515 [Breoghania sp. L-A4]|nr:hypothetical protein D1F64_21515 [Breoghania sp. L-A4]